MFTAVHHYHIVYIRKETGKLRTCESDNFYIYMLKIIVFIRRSVILLLLLCFSFSFEHGRSRIYVGRGGGSSQPNRVILQPAIIF